LSRQKLVKLGDSKKYQDPYPKQHLGIPMKREGEGRGVILRVWGGV